MGSAGNRNSYWGRSANGNTSHLHCEIEGSIPSVSTMKILIVDDEQYRHDLYKKVYNGHEITHVYSASDAIAALSIDEYDVVQLDHDLAD